MPVAPQALARIDQSPMRGPAVATIFEHMAAAMQLGSPAGHFTLDFQHPDDVLADSDLIPVITLSLRPAMRAAEST